MSYKYVRGESKEDYVHFWFKNSKTGRRINFTISDQMIQHALINTDSFCEVLEMIIKRLEEEKFYDQG